jgi:hypothetical protein
VEESAFLLELEHSTFQLGVPQGSGGEAAKSEQGLLLFE